jgi:hypothetical protein
VAQGDAVHLSLEKETGEIERGKSSCKIISSVLLAGALKADRSGYHIDGVFTTCL